MRHPETRAVLRALSGAGMLIASLLQLAHAEGRTLRVVAAIALAAVGIATLVESVRTYRRLRDDRESRGRGVAPRM